MAEIKHVLGKIATLERRAEHLQGRIDDPRRREASKAFDRAELAALTAGVKALRMHSALMEPENDPILALDELLETLCCLGTPRADEAESRAQRIVDTFAE